MITGQTFFSSVNEIILNRTTFLIFFIPFIEPSDLHQIPSFSVSAAVRNHFSEPQSWQIYQIPFTEMQGSSYTDVVCLPCSPPHHQELRQRSGDYFPGNPQWSVENQPVYTHRSALQSVSSAAQRFSNHYLQHKVIVPDEWNHSFLTSAIFSLSLQRFPDSRGQGGSV